MPFATIAGARIHYLLEGPASSHVLMFSNSLGTNFSMWDPQAGEFVKHFRILRYDTRGHGESSVTPGPYSIEQLGKDVIALLDALQLYRVHFCGLSIGGMIGMWLGFFFQAEDGIRDRTVTGVQTCAIPILRIRSSRRPEWISEPSGSAMASE